MKQLIILLAVCLLTSCATHQGALSITSFESNVCYVDEAMGSAKATYIFGIGGLTKQTLVNDAKRDLYRKRPLKEGEKYANISVDSRVTWLMIYIQNRITVTADIVKICDSNQAAHSEESLKDQSNHELVSTPSNSWFQVNDQVSYYNGVKVFEKCNIDRIIDKKADISYTDAANNKVMKSVSLLLLYKNSGNRLGYSIGDVRKFYGSSNVLVDGKVVGLGLKKMLVTGADGKCASVKY